MKTVLSRFYAGVLLGLSIPVIAVVFVVVESWALLKRLVPPPIKKHFENKRKEKEAEIARYNSLSDTDRIIEDAHRSRRKFLSFVYKQQMVERTIMHPLYLFMATALTFLTFSEPYNFLADALSASVATWLYLQSVPSIIRYAWNGGGFQMSEPDRDLEKQYDKLVELAYSAKEQELNLQKIQAIQKARGGKEYAG